MGDNALPPATCLPMRMLFLSMSNEMLLPLSLPTMMSRPYSSAACSIAKKTKQKFSGDGNWSA